jgi:tetratricopeptide (TPR) repeat protein
MSDRHPTHETLEAFSNGCLSTHAARAVVAHLVGGCFECRQNLALMTGPLFAPLPDENEEIQISAELDAAYDSAISAAYAVALAKAGGGRRDAARAIPGTEGLPLPGEPDFATPDVCETLMDRAYDLRFTDPAAMLRLAELAVQSAEGLDVEIYGAENVADLQARAWAEVANAHRVMGDLPQADRMMTRAVDCRSRGTGEPRLLARLSDLAAALACAQRRFDQAFRLHDISYSIYVKLGDRHSAGRVLIARGLYTGYTGDPLEGIRYLVHGLNTIDRVRDPKLAFLALHNIVLLRVELGEYEEARRTLRQMSPLYARFTDDVVDIKLRWVEGKIAAGLGELEEAEEAYAEARDNFDRIGLGYRAALVSLDLVAVWLQQGRTSEIRQLVAELLVTFRTVGVEREALAGVLLLRDAVECEQATVELLHLIAHSLGKLDGRSAPPLDPEVR